MAAPGLVPLQAVVSWERMNYLFQKAGTVRGSFFPGVAFCYQVMKLTPQQQISSKILKIKMVLQNYRGCPMHGTFGQKSKDNGARIFFLRAHGNFAHLRKAQVWSCIFTPLPETPLIILGTQRPHDTLFSSGKAVYQSKRRFSFSILEISV